MRGVAFTTKLVNPRLEPVPRRYRNCNFNFFLILDYCIIAMTFSQITIGVGVLVPVLCPVSVFVPILRRTAITTGFKICASKLIP